VEARHTERKCRFSRRKQAEARHTERKCRFSWRKQGTRRAKADLASGSKAHGEEMQIQQAEARHTERKY